MALYTNLGRNFTNSVKARILSVAKDFSVINPARLLINSASDDTNKDMPDSTISNPYLKEPRECVLCKYNIKLDYKNPKLLSQFVSPYTGRIYDKHITGLCDMQQKLVVKEIVKSRSNGYMAYVLKEAKFLKDEKLFNSSRPTRPHPH